MRTALALALTWCGWVHAQEPRQAVLTYTVDSGIDGCFETVELQDAVAARLGYVPFASEAPLSIRAHVHRQGSGLSADLKVEESGGSKARKLGSATRDCGELSRALALAISVAIDPMSLTRAPSSPPPEPSPEPPSPTTEPPAPAPTPAPLPLPPKPPTAPVASAPARRGADLDSRVRMRVLATGHAVLLGLPGITAGGSFGLGLRRRSLWADGELRYDLPGSADAREGGSVRAHLLGGTLAACHGNRHFGVCGLGVVARLAAEGADVPAPKEASTLWVGVGARVSAELSLSSAFFLRVHLDGLYRLTPVRLELRHQGVWDASPVSLVPGAGLGAQL